MDLLRLYDLLDEATIQLRKGDVVEHRQGVTHVYAMPPASEAPPGFELVDLEFILVGVDPAKAAARRDELVELLRDYPNPEHLAGGPSFIDVGAALGDQGAALQLFALGKVLGLWGVITPRAVGFDAAEARDLAGMGFVMITGWSPGALLREREAALG